MNSGWKVIFLYLLPIVKQNASMKEQNKGQNANGINSILFFQSRNITYAEFSQFLHDFHEEYALVAFRAKDKEGTGFISVKDFYDIMISIKSHLLTEPVSYNSDFILTIK